MESIYQIEVTVIVNFIILINETRSEINEGLYDGVGMSLGTLVGGLNTAQPTVLSVNGPPRRYGGKPLVGPCKGGSRDSGFKFEIDGIQDYRAYRALLSKHGQYTIAGELL